ncbi:MAG: hypothetical protein E7576_16625 [Ruminococcaceae bacterium]|nr:hypothetical protein [Oscillospiraceae bacterium]
MRRTAVFLSKSILFLLLAVVAVYLILAASAFVAGLLQYRRNAAAQDKKLAWLTGEFYPSYAPVGEDVHAAFDLSAELSGGIRLNEVSFLATHNSYQPRAALPYRLLLKAVSILPRVPVDSRLSAFEMDGLTEQLEHGIRSLELDVEAVEKEGGLSFIVTHYLLDNRSSCQDFEKALEELKLWSEHNPRHLPLIILIEPKTIKVPLGGMKSFDAECAAEFDGVIRESLKERLLAPGEVLGSYASFAELRADDGWPLLEDCLGRILFVLHPCPATDGYIGMDRSIRTQAMFPCLRYDGIREEYASFILDNNPESAANHHAEVVEELRLMVRTRADDYPEYSGARYASADRCGAQIVTTDYPPRDVRRDEPVWDFGGYTVRLRG